MATLLHFAKMSFAVSFLIILLHQPLLKSTEICLQQDHPGIEPEDWFWRDSRDCLRTRAELDEILNRHRLWLQNRRTGNGRADFVEAKLDRVILDHVNLEGAVLRGASFVGASLTKARLVDVEALTTVFTDANLQGADFRLARLQLAQFTRAFLHGADLSSANLEYANFHLATLIEATFSRTFVENAWFGESRLDSATIFELNGQPTMGGLAQAKGLRYLRGSLDRAELLKWRRLLRSAGFATAAGELNSAAWRAAKPGLFWQLILGTTCDYGAAPFRPILIFAVLWFFCLLLYTALICWPPQGRAQHHAIYLRGSRPLRRGDAATINANLIAKDDINKSLALSAIFSTVSAFGLGFKDLTTRNVVTIFFKRDLEFLAVGAPRILSGIQRVLSILLLLIWLIALQGSILEY